MIKTLLISVAATIMVAGTATAQTSSWNGLYIGSQAGYGWGNSSQRSTVITGTTPIPAPADGDYGVGGALVGGTLGYNIQMQQMLLGIEGDYAWSGISGSTICGLGTKCGTEMDSFGTLRARVGMVSGTTLFYVTGGWAFADVNAYDLNDPQEGSKMRSGWTIGGGIEQKLQGPMSLKLEYLYADFGKTEHFQTTGLTPESISLDTHVVRMGLNFKLGGDHRESRSSMK